MVAYPNDTYTLTAVDWGAFGQILQIQSSRIDPGVQQVLLAANGEVDATFVATMKSSPRIIFTTTNHNVMNYVCTGESRPSGIIWRWLSNNTETVG